ncbi:alkaline shock response membrane anchor protein AmaP [Streptomyces sp. CNQ085]|uniref:alkaline shock response membrane anchor protein AmaP n=1 Tax=Streptomyces sp. CNQ085 TaxID=2886944 RepID=UPI001F50473F|nr:alkaline shock response membrane anchor protein AmaP [Streptomyces sp. CNQ085]MCI0384620.1 alkaline shock response membrane anchor protein AmaP [Streptomyces sp. CNQ085]
MLTVANRILLGLLGLALLVLGLAALLGGLDLQRRWGFDLPWNPPWDGPDEVLLGRGEPAWWREADWWRWLLAIGVPAAVLLLALWWLSAQLWRQRPDTVLVDSGDGYGALVRTRTLEDAVAEETGTLPGAERARVRLGRRRSGVRARVALAVAAHAGPAEILQRLRDEALEHARDSAGLDELTAEVRLRPARR